MGLFLDGFLFSGALPLKFQPPTSPKVQSLLSLLKKTSTFYLSSVFLYHDLKIAPRLKSRVNAKLIFCAYLLTHSLVLPSVQSLKIVVSNILFHFRVAYYEMLWQTDSKMAPSYPCLLRFTSLSGPIPLSTGRICNLLLPIRDMSR